MADAKPQNIRTGADAPPREGTEDTPSQVIIKSAKKTVQIEDAQGRTLTVRKLSSLDRMRLFKLCGKDSSNDRYVGMAALAFAVTEIDGDVEPAINTARELEALVGRLDDDGLEAVAQAYVNAGWAVDDQGALSEGDINHLKNS